MKNDRVKPLAGGDPGAGLSTPIIVTRSNDGICRIKLAFEFHESLSATTKQAIWDSLATLLSLLDIDDQQELLRFFQDWLEARSAPT